MRFAIAATTSRTRMVAALTLCLAFVSTAPTFAQGGFAARHPRRAEVLRRDAHINGTLNRDRGHLGGHYGQLEAQDRSIRRQEQADARANGGYITPAEKAQLNHEETALRNETRMDNRAAGSFDANHPRRAEVLGRDNNLNRALWKDKGRLGGNFGALKQQDRSILKQEQADARANGGHITAAEQQQLNQEENSLRQQINQDHK